MAEASLHIYEALTSIGVKPDQARNVERVFESTFSLHQSQTEKNILDRVMTKEDGLRLEQKLGTEIAGVKIEIAGVKGDVRGPKWMLGFVFAGVLALVMKAFFNV
jgi:hypothetical protein